ncbi:hypothetical protein GCM10010429_51030 [Micromonospora olivasterospora]
MSTEPVATRSGLPEGGRPDMLLISTKCPANIAMARFVARSPSLRPHIEAAWYRRTPDGVL